MRHVVPGYVHRPGLHCGSSAMRNLLAFRGISLSEPMCFGLGSGAGFLYVPGLQVSPGVAFHGRVMEMERELCDALAIPFPERAEKDGDAGRDVRPEGPLRPLPEAIPLALGKNAREMLVPPKGSTAGISGMRRMAGEIPLWPEWTEDWAFAARFGYQVIEKRGTAGGFFRRLYSRYLNEASSHYPPLAGAGLSGKRVVIANGWTGVAGRLREISESGDAGAFLRVSDLLLRQADREEAFWREAASLA